MTLKYRINKIITLLFIPFFIGSAQEKFELFPSNLLVQPFIANTLKPKLGFEFKNGKNELSLNVGNSMDIVQYNFDDNSQEFITHSKEKFTEPIKYNLVFRSGVNESDVVGSGQYAFYIFSAYADKRINHKSAFQLGTDVYFSNFLKEFIYYNAVAFPSRNIDPDTDYKRVGIFAGHELFINKLSVVTQFGYYVYYPFDFEGRTYQRIGLKRYFNDKWFASLTLKSHAAKAEAVEVGIGIRL